MGNRTKEKFFTVEFKSEERETEFNQIVANFKRLGIILNIEKLSLNRAVYKVIHTQETDTTWNILWHKYMAMSHDEIRNESGEKFNPVQIFFVDAA